MADEQSPAVVAAIAAQIALLLIGCVALWRVQFRRRAERQPVRLPKWGISGFEFALAAFLVLAGAFVGQLSLALVPVADPDNQLIAQSAGFQGGLLLGALAAVRALRRASASVAASGKVMMPAGRLTAGLVTFLASLPVVSLISWGWTLLLEHLGFPTDRQEMLGIFARADSPLMTTLVIFLAVVVAPIVEELVFRAGLFRYLNQRLPRAAALMLPAVVFGSLHGNLVAFAPLVVLGIIFSLAYERTGNIAVPMIAHGLFNLNTLVLLLVGLDIESP